MLCYAYEIQSSHGDGPVANQRDLLGKTVTLRPAVELTSGHVWPCEDNVILVQQLQIDTRHELDAEVHAWIDSAPAGQKLEVFFRSIRLIWKSGRAFVQAPDSYVPAALDAVIDYALLAQVIRQTEDQAKVLGDKLLHYVPRTESRQHISVLREHLAQVTQLCFRLVDIRPYCELPARTGDVGMSTRLRTELLSQAQTSDGLDLVEHRLEIALNGFEAQLQRSQESWRGTLEAWIGFGILALLVIEYLF